MKIRAITNPISFSGFHTVLRGGVCEVPKDYEAGALLHVARGAAELVEGDSSAPPLPAPASAVVESAPVAADVEAAELAALQAELDALDNAQPVEAAPSGPTRPDRTVNCVHCGKPYTEHAKNNAAEVPDLVCKGRKRGFTPPASVTE